jgi:hypothetical protein
MSLELQVSNDLGAKEAVDRNLAVETLKPGQELLGHGAAAHQLAPLQHQHLATARARYAAVTKPLWPPPMMMASYWLDIGVFNRMVNGVTTESLRP